MREKISAILFLVVLTFIAIFCWEVFNRLFIQTSPQFSNSAVAAFFGAFLAFLFIRLADFFKSYSDRISKGHNALTKAELQLNSLVGELDDNVYVIESFGNLFMPYIEQQDPTRVFIWANRLVTVKLLDDIMTDLLNIDLINELFTLNTHLRKLNATMETLNGAYKKSEDALLSKIIDTENYQENLLRVYKNLLDINKFIQNSIAETTQALSAIRVLAKDRPLIGYLLIRLPSYKYDHNFESKREHELKTLCSEMEEIKKNDKTRINSILEPGEK